MRQLPAHPATAPRHQELLPCNIVVRATADGTIVEALDPQLMVTLTERPELKPVADEVSRRLVAALADLTSETTSDDRRE